MKKYKYSLFAVIFFIIAWGCNDDFLNQQIGTELKGDQAWVSYTYTQQFLGGIYSFLPGGFNDVDGAMLDAATDDAEETWESSDVQLFNNGSWGPYINPDDQWNRMFEGIRKANLFLENVHRVNLEKYRLDVQATAQTEYNFRLMEVERWKYEARFLRAFFYFELVKRYKEVPIITRTLTLDEDYSNIKRQPLDECIGFIVAELDTVGRHLNLFPGRTSTDNSALGRATKGAAYALKSRVLLYAASPLFLDPENVTATTIASDQQKWQIAAMAAKAVIDTCGATYQLVADYANFFNKNTSKDIIFQRQYPSVNDFEIANYPVGYAKGRSGTTPSQNLIDAYEMANGKPISDPSSGYDPQNPYASRDGRLAKTILLNNTAWNGRNVQSWVGGLDGVDQNHGTKTGYYLKKHVVPNVDIYNSKTAAHTWPLIRLAEVYLNYAEALNEYNPNHPDIIAYLNMVRTRAGMPNIIAGRSQDEMRRFIRNERRVELAFEGHRYWDVRRWKIAPESLGAPVYGVRITNEGNNKFSYQYVKVEDRVFVPKMYWYPIPQNELLKSPQWKQNPGWEL